MEIKSACDAIDVEALASEVQTADNATLHPAEIDFFKHHPAAGDEFVLVGRLTFYMKSAIGELMHQGVFTIFGKLRPLGFCRDAGGFEQTLP